MSRQFIRHGQLSPPAPHPPDDGGDALAREAPTPTNPGLESRLVSFSLWQPGHEGVRLAVTKASNWRPQSLQAYSKMGIW
jgi:hypothetical protein